MLCCELLVSVKETPDRKKKTKNKKNRGYELNNLRPLFMRYFVLMRGRERGVVDHAAFRICLESGVQQIIM